MSEIQGDYRTGKVWVPWEPPTKEDCLSDAEYYADRWWAKRLEDEPEMNHLHVVPAYGTFEFIKEHLAWHQSGEPCLLCDLTPMERECPRNESCFDWRVEDARR